MSMQLVEAVYGLTKNFPKHELYGLASQLQRCAVSIPSNIAEGHARDSSRDYLRYVSIAIGSLAELETQLILAGRLKYIDVADLVDLEKNVDEIGKMLRGVQRSMKKKLSPIP